MTEEVNGTPAGDAQPKRGRGRPAKTEAQPAKPPTPGTFPVKIVRGYFPMNGAGKVAIGEVVELPVKEAMRCLELGIAVRADALPIDDDEDAVEF